MNKERTLAYKVATKVDLNELQTVSGGSAVTNGLIVQTLKITGHPSFPDGVHDAKIK